MKRKYEFAEELKDLRHELVDVKAEIWSLHLRGQVSGLRDLEKRETDLQERIKAMEKDAVG